MGETIIGGAALFDWLQGPSMAMRAVMHGANRAGHRLLAFDTAHSVPNFVHPPAQLPLVQLSEFTLRPSTRLCLRARCASVGGHTDTTESSAA